jgi:hypothetical protein
VCAHAMVSAHACAHTIAPGDIPMGTHPHTCTHAHPETQTCAHTHTPRFLPGLGVGEDPPRDFRPLEARFRMLEFQWFLIALSVLRGCTCAWGEQGDNPVRWKVGDQTAVQAGG